MRGGHGDLCRLDALVGLDDVVHRLLDLARDIELGGLHARLRGVEVRARLAIAGDAIAAVEDRPVQVEVDLPRLVQVAPRGAVESARGDVGEEVARGAPQARLVRLRVQPRLPVFGPHTQRVFTQPRTVDRHRLVDEIVLDRERRGGGQPHRGRQRHARETLGVARADQIQPRVGHVHLGARDVGFRPRADLEEAARGAQVELGAVDGLLLDLDESHREVDIGERLLHRLRYELTLQLRVLEGDVGQLACGLGRREVLAEVEEHLGHRDTRDGRIERTLIRRRHRASRGRRKKCRGRDVLGRRGREIGGDLRKQRRERLINAEGGGHVVGDTRLDVGLGIERDGHRIVDREHFAEHLRLRARRRGRCRRRGRRCRGWRRGCGRRRSYWRCSCGWRRGCWGRRRCGRRRLRRSRRLRRGVRRCHHQDRACQQQPPHAHPHLDRSPRATRGLVACLDRGKAEDITRSSRPA